MSSRPALTARLERVLPELYALTSLADYPTRALTLVNALIGCDKSDYAEVDVARAEFRVVVLPEPPLLGSLGEARRAYMHQHPSLPHFLRTDGSEPRLISDFLPRREFHQLDLYAEFFRPLGVEEQLTVSVAGASTGTPAAISAHRGREGFTADDRVLFGLLRPHLVAARDNAIRFSAALSVQPWPAGPSGQGLLGRLTDRQHEILAQLSTGRTNGQIATALDISPGTVRKHLEHILRRLEVPTRTAAAVCFIKGTRPAPELGWTASLRLKHLPSR